MTALTFTWSTRRDGNNGYVLEQCGRYSHEYGPMPPHAVPAFAEGRRRYIAMLMAKMGANYVLEDPEEFLRQATQRREQETRDALRRTTTFTHPGISTKQ